jgi:hypothetical protein
MGPPPPSACEQRMEMGTEARDPAPGVNQSTRWSVPVVLVWGLVLGFNKAPQFQFQQQGSGLCSRSSALAGDCRLPAAAHTPGELRAASADCLPRFLLGHPPDVATGSADAPAALHVAVAAAGASAVPAAGGIGARRHVGSSPGGGCACSCRPGSMQTGASAYCHHPAGGGGATPSGRARPARRVMMRCARAPSVRAAVGMVGAATGSSSLRVMSMRLLVIPHWMNR